MQGRFPTVKNDSYVETGRVFIQCVNQRIALIIRRLGGISEHRKRSEFKPENGFREHFPPCVEPDIYGGLIQSKSGARLLKGR